ncbi:MAG TPA: hypothetical protein VMB77_00875 [Syntrophales bacterium]|nr:hypothetical protein [Syntrophales bacterium]
MKKAFVILVTLTFVVSTMGFAIAQAPPAKGTEAAPAPAKAEKKPKPDATLQLSEGQVALGIGWSWGRGTLSFKKKKYEFKVEGLSVVDVGITKATSKGKVYNLKKIEDFDGNYTSMAAEGTIGGGAGVTKMKNQNGVVIELVSTTQGANLKLAAEGVKFAIDK